MNATFYTHPQRFGRDFRHLFGQFLDDVQTPAAAWSPRVDVREEENRFVILADVPGIDPNAIDISTDRNVLTIKGERKAEADDDNVRATLAERGYGSFERSFTLPKGVDTSAITASGKHGVLTIAIPKKPEAAPRKIQITH